MHSHFLEYRLPDKPPFSSYDCPEDDVFGPLSLINLFVGPNNSGKSRLLRHLFIRQDLYYTASNFDNLTFRDFVKNIQGYFDSVFGSTIQQIGSINKGALDSYLDTDSRFLSPNHPVYDGISQLLQTALGSSGGIKGPVQSRNFESLHQGMKNFAEKALEQYNRIVYDANLPHRKRFYLPILRGMRPFDDQHKNIYQDRTIRDYFTEEQSGLKETHNVFTGLELYNILKAKLLGEPEDRDAVREFEHFLSANFFDSRRIALIPREGRNTVHVKIGEEKQLPLYELGDGLQNLIIITFNAFLEDEPCLFFIEEPDLCMHPGLQRALIETLSTKDQHQYFITTHSNHLLDMTLDYDDLSVFLFRKIGEGPEAKFSVTPASTRNNNVLRDLGVRNSSVFLTNATIWVEGITDRLYLRAYMKKYIEELKETDPQNKKLRKLKEDYHYSFVEYQGSNLTHWSFDPEEEDVIRIKASFICGNSFLIADGDIASKGDRVAVYKDMLGDNFEVLQCKELENLIPLEILIELIQDKFSKHGGDVSKLRYSDYSKLKGKGLGRYLDDKLKLLKKKTVFATKSGTVKSKVDFCKKAVDLMSDEDWKLTPPLKDLCEKIFTHIQQQNQ